MIFNIRYSFAAVRRTETAPYYMHKQDDLTLLLVTFLHAVYSNQKKHLITFCYCIAHCTRILVYCNFFCLDLEMHEMFTKELYLLFTITIRCVSKDLYFTIHVLNMVMEISFSFQNQQLVSFSIQLLIQNCFQPFGKVQSESTKTLVICSIQINCLETKDIWVRNSTLLRLDYKYTSFRILFDIL